MTREHDDDEPDLDERLGANDGRDCFSADELEAALGALTRVDFKRLIYVGMMLTRGMPMKPGELVSDAVQAAVEGRRRWPRDVSFLLFLKGVMSSLASSSRKAAKRSKVVQFPVVPNGKENPVELVADCAANPEQALLEREEEREAVRVEKAAAKAAEALNKQFENDYEVQLCMAGMMEGMKGEELRDFVGVDQAGLDYARKKIRRAKEKLFPKGWRHGYDQA